MDWRACRKKEMVKEIKNDEPLVRSLVKSSSNKIKSESLLRLNSTTATSKISLRYDALRELLEALAITKGYKIYNHDCFCAFLKEVLSESVMGNRFDKLRKIRNSINYYGKEVSLGETRKVLSDLGSLLRDVKRLLKSRR